MTQLCRRVALALALLAISTTPTWAGSAAWGNLMGSNPDKHQFVLMQGGKEYTYTLTDGAKVQCDGKECKLSDLKKGDGVVVLYVTVKGGLYALDVCSQPKAIFQQMKGQVKTSGVGKEFTLTSGGKDFLFTLTDHYHVAGDLKGGLTKTLKEGNEVKVDYVQINKGLYAFAVEDAKK